MRRELFLPWRLHGSLPKTVEILEHRPAGKVAWLYQLRAWVLMVNHVHILIYPEARLSRSRIAKAIKNYSARQANAILLRPAELEKIVRYIEKNALVAGLVSAVEEWRFSSAFGTTEGQARRSVPPSK